MDIWTDATITPEDALQDSAMLLMRHLSLIAGADVSSIEAEPAEPQGVPSRIYEVPVEDLELTVRAYNCLKRAGITKVGEVLEKLQRGEEEILAIRNFGRKSLNELVEKLDEKGYLSVILTSHPALTAMMRKWSRSKLRWGLKRTCRGHSRNAEGAGNGCLKNYPGVIFDEASGCRKKTGKKRFTAQGVVA